MEHNHTYMTRQNLADISHYAKLALDTLERGAGELPQWVNHLISTARTHMQDVGHFLRQQARKGKRFGITHPPGQGPGPWYGVAGLQPTARRYAATEERVPCYENPCTFMGQIMLAAEAAASKKKRRRKKRRRRGRHRARARAHGKKPGASASATARRFAGAEGQDPAYMARKNLREIAEYADASLALLEEDAGIFPQWVEHKISIVAQYMDTVGHFLENEKLEGRQYGSREFIPFPGDAGDVAYYYGIADGLGGQHRERGLSGFQIGVYEQGWREGNERKNKPDSQPMRAHYYGLADALAGVSNEPRWARTPYLEIYKAARESIEGRHYGARGGGGRRGGRDGKRGGARGRSPGAGGAPGGGGRPDRARGRPGVPAMGGRGRHYRKHRHRHHVYPAWGYPYHPWWGHLGYYPAPIYVEAPVTVPTVKHVYSHRVKRQLLPEIPDSHGVIGMTGANFSLVPDSMVIRYRLGTGEWREDKAVIISRDDGGVEIAVPVSNKVLGGFALGDIGYYINGDLISLGGTFFNHVPRPWNPFVSKRRFGQLGINRDLPSVVGTRRLFAGNPDQMPDMHRVRRVASEVGSDLGPPPEMIHQFMAPGPSGPLQPSSIMQTFPPSRMLEDSRMVLWSRMIEQPTGRQFGVPGHPYGTPGWAGQGGVAQRPLAAIRGGPRPVQTFGSLGYASMGDGSMDMAARGSIRR